MKSHYFVVADDGTNMNKYEDQQQAITAAENMSNANPGVTVIIYKTHKGKVGSVNVAEIEFEEGA